MILQWVKPIYSCRGETFVVPLVDRPHVIFLLARASCSRILSKFACFAMEGSHRRLKRMLRNSGGLSLLRGRLGLLWMTTPLMTVSAARDGIPPSGACAAKGP